MAGGSVWKKGWGLGAELTISLVLLVVFSTGLLGLALGRLYQNDLLMDKAKEMSVLAEALAFPISVGGGQSDLARLYQGGLARQAGVDGVVLTDRQGRSRVLFGRPPDEALINQAPVAEAQAPDEFKARIVERGFWLGRQPPLISVSIPLASGGGRLEVWLSFDDFLLHQGVIRRLLVVSLLINGLAAYCFSRVFINRRLIAPLRHLAKEMAALAEERFQPNQALAHVYPGEMGWIFASFERAADCLIRNRAELTKNIETIKKAQKRLIQAEKMASVGRLAAGLAHELGNPLGAVVGMIYLLKRDDLSEAERKQFLERSLSELDRMRGLIHSLLNFSRPSKAVVEPLALEPIIDEALALAGHQKWFRGVKVEKTSLGEARPVLAERNLLLQVLLNLLSNSGHALAEKSGPEQALVQVAVVYGEGRALVTVADNGPGLETEDMSRLFEPFFTKKAPGEGTGLGLSICHSIIAGFGGRLEAYNGQKGGAEFIFGLPVLGTRAFPSGAEPGQVKQEKDDDDANKK